MVVMESGDGKYKGTKFNDIEICLCFPEKLHYQAAGDTLNEGWEYQN